MAGALLRWLRGFLLSYHVIPLLVLAFIFTLNLIFFVGLLKTAGITVIAFIGGRWLVGYIEAKLRARP